MQLFFLGSFFGSWLFSFISYFCSRFLVYQSQSLVESD